MVPDCLVKAVDVSPCRFSVQPIQFWMIQLSELLLAGLPGFGESRQFRVPPQEYGFTPENQVELSLE
jgi:hypothetical protein